MKWSRFDRRNNTMGRRDVPNDAIEDALKIVRDSISYKCEHD